MEECKDQELKIIYSCYSQSIFTNGRNQINSHTCFRKGLSTTEFFFYKKVFSCYIMIMKDKHVLCICRLPDIGAFRKLKGAIKSNLLRELFLVFLFPKDHFYR